MTSEISALDFKSATLYAIRVVLQHADTEALIKALKKRMADAGTFFENEPVVIDAAAVETVVDWVPLLKAFADHRLPVIGVVAQGDNLAAAKACGLAAVDLSTSPVRNASDTQTAASVAEPVTSNVPTPAAADAIVVSVDGAAAIAGLADTASPAATTTSSMVLEASGAVRNDTPAAAPTMVVRGPLRSGQRVYARQSDLIVMGVVSRGAEVIADGNIHVYGPLRGKAMAGARGDTAARIFTTSLDAELVAVAGIYRVIDSKLPAELHQRPAVIQLQKDALHLTPLEK
jgi:septum site-determining protein MinC